MAAAGGHRGRAPRRHAGLPRPEPRGRGARCAGSTTPAVAARPDVYFPVLHGTFGEDGTIQGLLELAGVPFVGSGIAASAAAMDKALMKALFAAAVAAPGRLPRAARRATGRGAAAIVEPLGLPLFVKPANLGSSVGVSKVKEVGALAGALDVAFAYDRKVVVEAAVPGAREIEVSVLGNDEPAGLAAGRDHPRPRVLRLRLEVLAGQQDRSSRSRPRSTPQPRRRCAGSPCRCSAAVDASGYARVDFLMERATGKLVVNEINTIPGFTSISMFPKLWAATGLAYEELLGRLVQLGLDRHRAGRRLRTDYRP